MRRCDFAVPDRIPVLGCAEESSQLVSNVNRQYITDQFQMQNSRFHSHTCMPNVRRHRTLLLCEINCFHKHKLFLSCYIYIYIFNISMSIFLVYKILYIQVSQRAFFWALKLQFGSIERTIPGGYSYQDLATLFSFLFFF